MLDKPEDKPRFDPDLSSQSEANKRAAKAHGLRWDPRKQSYVGSGGELVHDRFGQPF